MEFKGILKFVDDTKSGSSMSLKKGTWYRKEFVVETTEEYPQVGVFEVWKEDLVHLLEKLPIGSTVTIRFSLKANEYQGRWYNRMSCFNIESPYLQRIDEAVKRTATPINEQQPTDEEDLPF